MPRRTHHLTPQLIIPVAPADIPVVSMPVGGFPLLRRTVLTAQHAGFTGITIIATAGSFLPDGIMAGVPVNMTSTADITEGDVRGPALILSPLGLPNLEFFKHVAEVRDIGARSFGAEPVALLTKLENSHDLVAAMYQIASGAQVPVRLAQSVKAVPDVQIGGYAQVHDAEDIRQAEKHLLAGLTKATDGYLARLINRRVSLAVTRRLMRYPVTPNHMTLVSTAIGLAAAPCFLSTEYGLQLAGALLFLLHSMLDGCDGELARLKFMASRLGGTLDFWSDNLVHMAVFACMGIGWGLASAVPWPFLLAAGAVGGTLLSAALVYAHSMRGRRKAGPLYTSVSTLANKSQLARLADTLSRRDFIYLVLLLALFGKAHWFVLAAGIGTPLFAVLLVTISRSDKRHA